jgi:hypothetical protein
MVGLSYILIIFTGPQDDFIVRSALIHSGLALQLQTEINGQFHNITMHIKFCLNDLTLINGGQHCKATLKLLVGQLYEVKICGACCQ